MFHLSSVKFKIARVNILSHFKYYLYNRVLQLLTIDLYNKM